MGIVIGIGSGYLFKGVISVVYSTMSLITISAVYSSTKGILSVIVVSLLSLNSCHEFLT